ncbi:MAG: aspartate carbamoyltransferase regulatory subunit [Gammaproteobacteria bacterium]|nr:aspartate carbamoyltransferase regulatory subunit [Gammaproteobacteria bacterium]
MTETAPTTNNETLPVSAIKNGTVIDHITQGQALRIIHLLGLASHDNKVTIGLHLPSKRLGNKDLIKIENRILTEDEANEIVIFSPLATINVIQNFDVSKKYTTHLPKTMKKVFICRNPTCVTQAETVDSYFHITEQGKQIKLTCHYCEKTFDRDQLKVNL